MTPESKAPDQDFLYTDPNDPNLYPPRSPAATTPPPTAPNNNHQPPTTPLKSEERRTPVVVWALAVLVWVRQVAWWAVKRGWSGVGDCVWRGVGVVWRRPWIGLIAGCLVAWLVSAGYGWTVTVCAGLLVGAGLTGGRATLRVRRVSLARQVKYRNRARQVRTRWVQAMTNASMTRPGENKGDPKVMPRILRMRPHAHGITLTLDASPVGKGVHDFIEQAQSICHSLGCLSLRAQEHPGGRAGRAIRVDLRWTDPFPTTIALSDLPPARRRNHIVTGLDEDGNGLERNIALPNLEVGAQGAGKSTDVWTMLYQLMKAGIPVRLRIFDPKGGTELGILEDACWDYASNPAQWAQFLGRACGALQVRQSIMKSRGMRSTEPSDEFPLDLMVIDELVTVLAMSRGTMRAFGMEVAVKDAFAVYLSQQRAAGSSTIALSQLGEKDVIGPARGLFSYITCLRVNPTEKALVDILLGQGASRAYPAHQLQPGPETAGIGWTTTEKRGVVRYRGANPTEAERMEVLEWLRASLHNQRKVSAPDPAAEGVRTAPKPRPRKAASKRAVPAGQGTTADAVTETGGEK